MDGVRVPLAGYDGAVPAAGTEAILGVRPEHVMVRADGDGLPAVMDIDEPMGSDSLLWLTFGNPLRARASADHGFTHGQPVRVGFDIARASLFDRETEQRLRHARPFRVLDAFDDGTWTAPSTARDLYSSFA